MSSRPTLSELDVTRPSARRRMQSWATKECGADSDRTAPGERDCLTGDARWGVSGRCVVNRNVALPNVRLVGKTLIANGSSPPDQPTYANCAIMLARPNLKKGFFVTVPH